MNITSFNLKPTDRLTGTYTVIQRLGKGWEGEVFLVREKGTGIERAAKLFYPHRNKGNKTLRFYARKLHELRNCSILIQYYTQDTFVYKGKTVHFLLSEFVQGELLSSFVKRQSGRRLHAFQALHLLYSLVSGLEEIHARKQYHGDIHLDNIIIERYGLGFKLKLIDMYNWDKKTTRGESRQDDVVQLIRVFYEVLGGRKWYSKQPAPIKAICLGLKSPLIIEKFRTAGKLKRFIENIEW